MVDLDLDIDEAIVLENNNVTWASRDYITIDNLVLTNKRLYCSYKKSNGLFKKSTDELCSFNLSDIKIINGQAQAQNVKYRNDRCLQIQFVNGREIFKIYTSPKKVISQWVEAINDQLGTTYEEANSKKSINPFSKVVNSSIVQDTMNNLHSGLNQILPSNGKNNRVCPECGADLSPDDNFCSLCGKKVVYQPDTRSPNIIQSYFQRSDTSSANTRRTKTDSVKRDTYKFMIKSRTFSIGTAATILVAGHLPKGDDVTCYYKTYDHAGVMQYTVKAETNLTNRDILNVYDSESNKIGRIKEHFLSVGVPLLEKETKKCSVYLGGEKICELKKSEIFGESHFEVLSGDVQLSYDQKGNFKITYQGKQIADFQVIPRKLKEQFRDAFVDDINLECYYKEHEEISILLAIAIDTIRI